MTPVGGLSMLFHLAIIGLRHRKKVLLSLLIVLVVTVIFGTITFASLMTFGRGNSNVRYLLSWLNPCQATEASKNEKRVVLRLDDVQAFTWEEVTTRMIDEALGNNITLTLGVIPIGLLEDQKMLQSLRDNACNLEIAQHGWDHQDDPPEFAGLDEEEAYQRIVQGKTALQKIANDPIVTFIPPHNLYSEGTRRTLEKTGFQIISGEGGGDFDYTTSTYDFSNHQLNPVSEVIDQCQEGLDKNNFCIIMLHPQDYATDGRLDKEKYESYSKLLRELKELDVSFVRMKDLRDSDKEKNFSEAYKDGPQFSAWLPWWDEERVLTSFKKAKNRLSSVSPVWYRLGEEGRISEIETSGKQEIINAAKNSGTAIAPAITNDFDDKRVSVFLGDEALKESEIEKLVKIAQSSGYRGWDLDWEEIAENNRGSFVDFVGLLAQRLHEENLLLSVSVHAQTGQEDDREGCQGQDWSGLAKEADFIRIMAYDFHHAESEPGPVTPPDELEEVLKYAVSVVPKEKIVLGLPTYGYDWGAGKGESFQYIDILERINGFGGYWHWEADSLALKGNYTLDGVEHVLWFENGESLAQKISLARSYGIDQFCFWRLGGEDEKIWELDF